MSLKKMTVEIALNGPDGIVMTPVKAWGSKTLPVAITKTTNLQGDEIGNYGLSHTENGLIVAPKTFDTIREGRAAITYLEEHTSPEDWRIWLDDSFNPPLWRFHNRNVENAVKDYFCNRS